MRRSEVLGGVGGGETIIRIYSINKIYVQLKRVVNVFQDQCNYISTLNTPGYWALVGIALLGFRNGHLIFSFLPSELRNIILSTVDSIICKYGVLIFPFPV